jgi:hypothetical protein
MFSVKWCSVTAGQHAQQQPISVNPLVFEGRADVQRSQSYEGQRREFVQGFDYFSPLLVDG